MKAIGYGSDKEQINDTFTFDGGGTFEFGSDVQGTWSQAGKVVVVTIDNSELLNLLNSTLDDIPYGYLIEVDSVNAFGLTITTSTRGFRASMVFGATISVPDYDVYGVSFSASAKLSAYY